MNFDFELCYAKVNLQYFCSYEFKAPKTLKTDTPVFIRVSLNINKQEYLYELKIIVKFNKQRV